MPKIPQFDQNRLASSVTAVPQLGGGTLSTAANMVGRAALGVQNELEAQARTNNVIHQEYIREVEAQKKAQKVMLDKMDSANAAVQWKTKVGQRENEIKAGSRENPDTAPKAFADAAQQDLNDFLDGITNPDVKKQVQLSATQDIAERVGALNNWVFTQRTENAKAAFDNNLLDLQHQAGDAATAGDVGGIWATMDSLQEAAVIAYGADAHKVLRQAKTQAAKNFINGKMIKDFSQVRPIIESGAFDSVLETGERKNLIKEAGQLAKAEENQVMRDVKIQAIEQQTSLSLEESNVDQDDINSINGFIQTNKAILEQEMAKPPEMRNLGLINQAKSAKIKYEGLRDNFASDQQKEENKKAATTYSSDTAVEERVSLSEQWARISTKKYTDADSAIKDLDAHRKRIQDAYDKNYLTSKQLASQMASVEKKRQLLNNKASKGGLVKQLGDARDAIMSNTMQFFSTIPSFSGGNPKRSHDSMNQSYVDKMERLTEQYKRLHNGTEPSGDALKKLDKMARDGVATEYGRGQH